MKIRNLMLLIASMFALSANSATLVINDGQLMGATDVDVGGTLYNVSFLDVSCNSLHDGCSDFTFNTESAAAKVSQALLDQVLIGPYDDEPGATLGSALTQSKNIAARIAGLRRGAKGVSIAMVINEPYGGPADAIVQVVWDPDDPTDPFSVFVVWAPSAVPLPAAAWLFMSAIAFLAGGKRISRSKRSAIFAIFGVRVKTPVEQYCWWAGIRQS